MGMHHGILVASAPWPRFLGALSEVAGEFIAQAAVARLEGLELTPNDAGFPVVGGELDDQAYLLDTSMILSMGFDRVVDVSASLDCTVAACCGETVSGSFYFVLADGGEVRRAFAHCLSAVTQPFEAGAPLVTEASAPFTDLDGAGFTRALTSCGFDYPRWVGHGTKTAFLFTDTRSTGRRPGALDASVEQHLKAHEIPVGGRPKPKVVVRRGPDGSIGWDVTAREARPTLFDVIKRLFGRG